MSYLESSVVSVLETDQLYSGTYPTFTLTDRTRHRGAKQPRRFGLLGVISLLSLAYLLSVDRRPFRSAPSGHYGRLSSLIDLYIFQSGKLLPLRAYSEVRDELTFAHPRYSLGGGHPSQTTNLAACHKNAEGWYLTVAFL